jgi:uncharacterized membrane protein required for colicin V production
VIIASCALYGFRKGLILTAAGIIITILSIFAAWGIAAAFTPVFAQTLEKNLAPTIESVLNAVAAEKDLLPDMTNITDERISAAASEALENLGFAGGGNSVLGSAVIRKIEEAGLSLRQSMLSAVCGAIAFSGLFMFGFLIIRAALEVAAGIVSKMFKLPGLNLINKLGGIAAGVIHGVLILFVLGWVLQFAGVLISGEDVAGTAVMKHFTDTALFGRLTELIAGRL